LLVGLAWGQAATPKPAPAGQSPAVVTTPSPAPAAPPAVQVPPDTAVITIKGLCSAADKTTACNTIITRAEFEKLIDAVQPSMPARSRRPFADRWARSLMMAKKGQDMGLDKSPNFDERMRVSRIQILAQELGKALQEQAAQISDKDIEDYYHANQSRFDEVDVDRIYVPKNRTPPETDKAPSEAEEQKFQQDSEKIMKDEADKLHARAVKGEDFVKLQEDAFEAAGIKTGSPNTKMGKVRRTVLAQNQTSVMDLKPGEVSVVIVDLNGFFIYKMNAKSTMPVTEAREEIKATLRSERMQAAMQAVQQSATVTLDENYFGPEMPARGPMLPPGAMPPPPAKPPAPGPK
jgi:hypothetical protein